MVRVEFEHSLMATSFTSSVDLLILHRYCSGILLLLLILSSQTQQETEINTLYCTLTLYIIVTVYLVIWLSI